MLRVALLAVLPLIAVCQLVPQPFTRQHFDDVIKPCILEHKCSNSTPVEDKILAQIVQRIRDQKSPEECNCDLTVDACIRSCFYAQTVNIYMIFAIVQTVGQDATDLQNQYRRDLETQLKPCALEGKGCQPTMGDMSISFLKTTAEMYKDFFSLPPECSCDLSSTDCIRPCAVSVAVKNFFTNPTVPFFLVQLFSSIFMKA